MSNLTNNDLIELTAQIKNYWEILAESQPRLLARKKQSFWKSLLEAIGIGRRVFPVQVLYRFVKESWQSGELSMYLFPFEASPVTGVFALSQEWHIRLADRRFLSQGPLYASDGRTIIVPNKRKWWDTNLAQLILLLLSIAGLILGLLPLLKP